MAISWEQRRSLCVEMRCETYRREATAGRSSFCTRVQLVQRAFQGQEFFAGFAELPLRGEPLIFRKVLDPLINQGLCDHRRAEVNN